MRTIHLLKGKTMFKNYHTASEKSALRTIEAELKLVQQSLTTAEALYAYAPESDYTYNIIERELGNAEFFLKSAQRFTNKFDRLTSRNIFKRLLDKK